MSLQVDVEEFIRPLVSALYESSEEDMENDSASMTAIEQDQDADNYIEVIACYRETPVYLPQLAGGRAMTFDHDAFTDNEIQYFCGPSGSFDSTFDPSDSLVDWLVGSPPTQSHTANDPNHRMATCSQMEPIPYSPMSPPLIDQGPSQNIGNNQWAERPEQVDSWITNQHITGLAISTGGSCGEPNYIQRGHCTVCGKSFATTQEEITLGYLEQTHIPEENYAQRIRRRNAFLAGMRAGSVTLVPGGVSQAAACDGILYQIAAGNSVPNPPPGVLPI